MLTNVSVGRYKCSIKVIDDPYSYYQTLGKYPFFTTVESFIEYPTKDLYFYNLATKKGHFLSVTQLQTYLIIPIIYDFQLNVRKFYDCCRRKHRKASSRTMDSAKLENLKLHAALFSPWSPLSSTAEHYYCDGDQVKMT